MNRERDYRIISTDGTTEDVFGETRVGDDGVLRVWENDCRTLVGAWPLVNVRKWEPRS